ncbi:hypothetical protein WJX73_002978 [Symbiochloris irregularis]|uniref:FAD-binding domain-containing protein n=1 Tax=Symbiochloris irregularis TaxID=706552 RepID=A0AAW1PJE0_9CHLO
MAILHLSVLSTGRASSRRHNLGDAQPCVGLLVPTKACRRKRHSCRSYRKARCLAVAQQTLAERVSGQLQGKPDELLDAVIIAGAGIGGLAAAAALTKLNVPVVVLERASKPRDEGGAIALWPNAFRALDALGLAQSLREAHPLLERVELWSSSGEQLRTFALDECEGAPHEFRGVARGELLAALRSAVPAEKIIYDCPVNVVHALEEGMQVTLEDGSDFQARIVVGADGTRSRVSSTLRLLPPSYSGYSAYRGVADISGTGLQPLTPSNIVRQLFGEGVRTGLYPLSASQWYWFVCWNCPADDPALTGEEGKAHALSLVQDWADSAGAKQAIANTPAETITRSRVVDRWRLPGMRTPSHMMTLLGDAAHPMTPNLGQGGCCALEDAVVLARELAAACTSSGDGSAASSGRLSLMQAPTKGLTDALRRFEKERSARVLPITIRSHLMGRILQLPQAPVCAVRNAFISKALPISNFMGHTMYDCGPLATPA